MRRYQYTVGNSSNSIDEDEEQEIYEENDTLISTLKKTTDLEGNIAGYIVSTKAESSVKEFLYSQTEQQKTLIEEKLEEISDLAENLLENKDNPVIKENSINSINDLLGELWSLRSSREKEYAKLIVLIQTITRRNIIDASNNEHIKALVDVLRKLKIPKITEFDIKDSIKVIEAANLNIYRPLQKKPTLEIIIKQ